MSKTDEIRAANAAGNLLSGVAGSSYGERDCLSSTLAELHNSGEFDFVSALGTDSLDSLSGQSFFQLQHVFCQTLPRLDCAVEAAAAACHVLYEKAAGDLTAGLVYDALRQWAELDPRRVEDGLAMVRNNADIPAGPTRSLLLAGAAHDVEKATEEALDLSRLPSDNIRLDSLVALGRMPFQADHRVPGPVMQRLEDAIQSPLCDPEAGIAVESALNVLSRIGSSHVGQVEPLLLQACADPNRITRQAIANGLRWHANLYTNAMLDRSFGAIKFAERDETITIRVIDSILDSWDIDADRERILEFLTDLLTHSKQAIKLEALSSFRHSLANGPGHLLGWYVVSLLLTGDHRLCRSADRLLPYQEAPDGLDIDLTPFALDPPWVPYLARKILGYCLIHPASVSALLLSCLRAVSGTGRSGLETLVRDHFLINYPGAIKRFEAGLTPGDRARASVKRLSEAIGSYLDGLRDPGFCDAFQPGERERWLQFQRKVDHWQELHRKAEEQSIFAQLAHKSVLLFGTRSIVYLYTDDESDPKRQEVLLASHEHTAEFPRLTSIDPVGLNFAMHRFRIECPPS